MGCGASRAAVADGGVAVAVLPEMGAASVLRSAEEGVAGGHPAPASLDSTATSFIGPLELDQVLEALNESACLFARSVEASASDLALLCLVSAGANEAAANLRTLASQQQQSDERKFTSIDELVVAIRALQGAEVARAVGVLPARVQMGVLEAHALLAPPTCPLLVTVTPATTTTPADAEEDVDFNALNTQMLTARMRLKVLSIECLIHLVVAGGKSADGSYVAPIILQHLTLAEQVFDTPTALINGVSAHRVRAMQEQEALRLRVSSEGLSTSVPESLAKQVAPLHQRARVVQLACSKLRPLMEPLLPTLARLTPTMRHVQAYLSRFLPLLQESAAAAQTAGLAPHEDTTTADLLRAYLIPFLKLCQPWLMELRPYLTGLQPMFTELQPALAHTHALFTLAHPLLHQLAHMPPNTAATEQTEASSFMAPACLLDDGLASFLVELVGVVGAVHPLLQQVHPLMRGLLELMAELAVFLEQLQQLLDLLATYQTEPLQEEPPRDRDHQNEPSVSSIARPWFDEAVSRPGSANGEQPAADKAAQSAPRYLSVHGRFLLKLVPYVSQLRPFASEVRRFVDTFVPFVDQLAPFYRQALKSAVTPLQPLLLARDLPPAATDAHEDAAPVSADVPAPEMDEAALARLLSS